jgi:uncharacterized protein YjiS (DUF1127 family)
MPGRQVCADQAGQKGNIPYVCCSAAQWLLGTLRTGVLIMLALLPNAFRKLGTAVIEWRKRERAFGELMALDDRTLADVGIRRSEIPFVLSGAAKRAEERPDAEREIRGAANSNAAPPRRVA